MTRTGPCTSQRPHCEHASAILRRSPRRVYAPRRPRPIPKVWPSTTSTCRIARTSRRGRGAPNNSGSASTSSAATSIRGCIGNPRYRNTEVAALAAAEPYASPSVRTASTAGYFGPGLEAEPLGERNSTKTVEWGGCSVAAEVPASMYAVAHGSSRRSACRRRQTAPRACAPGAADSSPPAPAPCGADGVPSWIHSNVAC